jgi:hypothetical protein
MPSRVQFEISAFGSKVGFCPISKLIYSSIQDHRFDGPDHRFDV